MRGTIIGTSDRHKYAQADGFALSDTIAMAEENYSIETEEEPDGRWIAEIIDFPDLLMAYGRSKGEAAANVMALAFRIIAERIQQTNRGTTKISFGIIR